MELGRTAVIGLPIPLTIAPNVALLLLLLLLLLSASTEHPLEEVTELGAR